MKKLIWIIKDFKCGYYLQSLERDNTILDCVRYVKSAMRGLFKS